MDIELYNALSSKPNSGKTICHSWLKLFQEHNEHGTKLILQLFIDMTGFGYTVADTDLDLVMSDDPEPLDNKITLSSLQTQDIFQNGIFFANFTSFWQQIIVNNWKKLLTENMWFNKSLSLVMVLCQSSSDECAIVGSFIGATLLPMLCAARQNLLNDIERVACWRDNQRKSSLERKDHYIVQVCEAVLSEIGNGFKYSKLSNLLMEKICEAYALYPDFLILQRGGIELLGAGLLWKNWPSVQLALKCLKQLLSDTYSGEINEKVAIFILRKENQLTRIMDTYKSCESTVLHLLLDALSLVGNIPFGEETADKIVHKMFSTDEAVVNAAIDLHGMYYASQHPPAELETNALLAILEAFEQCAYPLTSFDSVVKKLWIKGFFRTFDGLFAILVDARDRGSDACFIVNCVAHTITYCHQLLLEDIRAKNSPSLQKSESANWNFIRQRMETFVHGFPNCLNAASQTPNVYNLLLQCMNPENNELYSLAGVDCEAYHEEVLFNILSKIALNECSYQMLFQTLTTIYSFDTIAHISEDIWNELTETYYTCFFHTRSRLRSYNLGINKKLMEAYTTAITRLCVLIEINNTSEHVFKLAEYLANDLQLLPKMNLSDESTAIFYRLYKNALYASVQYCLTVPINNLDKINFDQLGKRALTFVGVLVEQLKYIQQPFTVSGHIANALCDMFVLTQNSDASAIMALVKQHLVYHIEPEVLEKLSKYIEHHVFGGSVGPDEESNHLLARKLMLTAYNDVYRMHFSLPRLSDAYNIAKHYGANTLFTNEIEHLLSIVYGKDPDELFHIAALVITDYCKKANYNSKVKKFVINLQQFTRKCSANQVNEKECLANIIQSVINHTLEEVYAVDGLPPNEAEKLIKTMIPFVSQLLEQSRKELNQLIRQHPNFSIIMEDKDSEIRTILKSFMKLLKK